MKLLFDFLPIVLFFIAFKFYGIYAATLIAIIASTLQVSWFWIKNHRFENMHLLTLGLIVLLGGATLFFHEEMFIKWKPTALNWIFALMFIGSHFIGKKTMIQQMMDKNVSLPSPIWSRLNISWILFFIVIGFANLYVVYHFDTNTWVNFKLFGVLGLTLVFIIIQAFFMTHYMEEHEHSKEKNSTLT